MLLGACMTAPDEFHEMGPASRQNSPAAARRCALQLAELMKRSEEVPPPPAGLETRSQTRPPARLRLVEQNVAASWVSVLPD